MSTAAFLYSPTIRSQYAYRYPDTPETTVRFNDFLFAAHGALLCVIIYTQFFPWIWGFKVGKRQTASKAVLGIFWGCIFGILITLGLVWTKGEGGYDPSRWAWLDVVSLHNYVLYMSSANDLIRYTLLGMSNSLLWSSSIFHKSGSIINGNPPPVGAYILCCLIFQEASCPLPRS